MILPETKERDNNYDLINHMLLKKEPSELQMQYSFLIHSPINEIAQKYFTRSGIEILQQLGSYELTVGTNKFDMEILVLGSQNRSVMAFKEFLNLFQISQYTYFWDEKITLFREVDRYYQLEEFIASNDLNKHVISVEEISGINSFDVPIKLVTFDSTIQRAKLLTEFKWFLNAMWNRGESPDLQIYHYYFTNAFPWHQPEMPRLYSIPFRNQRIFLGLQTFLTWMRVLTYTREPHLDLISLCSLKLAFCDDRNLTEATRDLGYEIDSIIERCLCRMQQNQSYIQDGDFDLKRYAIDTNSSFVKSCISIVNLIYTFQHIFHRTNLHAQIVYAKIIPYEFGNILKLVDENIDLKKLRDSSNICYQVDAEYYKNMNSKLFCELLKCNVNRIRLDTNYKWTNEPFSIDFSGTDNSKRVKIELAGSNEFNFIEGFIQFLKTITISSTSKMTLIIEKVTIKSCHIFKNLEIEELNFIASKITFAMLTELLECDLKHAKIVFNKCTIDDQICTWSVLINGFDRKSVKAEIFEAENTWQYLFESITNHLNKFKVNEFKFVCDLRIGWQNLKAILLRDINFMFDECNTQLEMRDLDGEKIDLYYLKNLNVLSEKKFDYTNFEFYQ